MVICIPQTKIYGLIVGGIECGKEPDANRIEQVKEEVQSLENMKCLGEYEAEYTRYLAENNFLTNTINNTSTSYSKLF